MAFLAGQLAMVVYFSLQQMKAAILADIFPERLKVFYDARIAAEQARRSRYKITGRMGVV